MRLADESIDSLYNKKFENVNFVCKKVTYEG